MLKFVLYIKIIKISEAELDSYRIVRILKCVEIVINIKIKTHKQLSFLKILSEHF